MDAYETRKNDWEGLDVTREELENIKECLEKDEFRKLLIEYAEEINDPKNRKIYEREIAQLEKERGVDVTFVNPEPGYVIKTSVDGDKKCFLNISKSDIVAKPSSQPSFEEGNRGLQWSIPYTLVPPRDDLDKRNLRCVVFDVVFHPDTIYLASKNARFRDIVNDTAMDGVETNFNVKLDRKNIKFPKMSFKGSSQPTVVRKVCENPPTEKTLDIEPEIYQKLMSSYDESRQRQKKIVEEKPQRPSPATTYFHKTPSSSDTSYSTYSTPKFIIKHQSDIELEDFTNSKDAKLHSTVPKKLIVVVDLPLLKSASDAELDVQERSLFLKSEKPAKYKLELPLPYTVDADNGNAKFDVKLKKLTVTLPVVIRKVEREDSGVDSDHGSPTPRRNEEENVNSSESQSESSIIVLSGSANVEECEDTALRTKIDSFLNSNFKYSLPPFICNLYDNLLAVTVNVKNVDADSIRYKILDENSGIHITLSSMGAGFFPVYYSLCLKIEKNSIDASSLTIEPWDNNVVFTTALKYTENLARYYVGVDEEFMEAKDLPTSATLKNKLQELLIESPVETERKIQVCSEGNDVVINIRPTPIDSDDEDEHDLGRKSERTTNRKQERKHSSFAKSRSVSESSGDELPCRENSMTRSKGILKHRRNDFSRSVSESSVDDSAVHTSSIDIHYDSVQEINSESDCSSLKKTVRFNDVVSRQLFRSNSSILGQRKKNQRKLRNKKRAHDRRLSESENSETEERDKYKISPKNASEGNWVKPILNREKLSELQKSSNGSDSQHSIIGSAYNHNHDEYTSHTQLGESFESKRKISEAEFKSDLIFDLDM